MLFYIFRKQGQVKCQVAIVIYIVTVVSFFSTATTCNFDQFVHDEGHLQGTQKPFADEDFQLMDKLYLKYKFACTDTGC